MVFPTVEEVPMSMERAYGVGTYQPRTNLDVLFYRLKDIYLSHDCVIITPHSMLIDETGALIDSDSFSFTACLSSSYSVGDHLLCDEIELILQRTDEGTLKDDDVKLLSLKSVEMLSAIDAMFIQHDLADATALRQRKRLN